MKKDLLYLVTYRIEQWFPNKKADVSLIIILYKVATEKEAQERIEKQLIRWQLRDKAFREHRVVTIFDFRCITYILDSHKEYILEQWKDE